MQYSMVSFHNSVGTNFSFYYWHGSLVIGEVPTALPPCWESYLMEKTLKKKNHTNKHMYLQLQKYVWCLVYIKQKLIIIINYTMIVTK